MNAYLIVALGSALGGTLRHGVNATSTRLPGLNLSYCTLNVNVLGSFVWASWQYPSPRKAMQRNHGEDRVWNSHLTPPVVRRYSETVGLDDAEQDDLRTAVTRLLVWVDINGHLQSNPHLVNTAT